MRACRIGRADIEESKSGIALNAPPPQASYPCGNFSGISAVDTNYVQYVYTSTEEVRWAVLSHVVSLSPT